MPTGRHPAHVVTRKPPDDRADEPSPTQGARSLPVGHPDESSRYQDTAGPAAVRARPRPSQPAAATAAAGSRRRPPAKVTGAQALVLALERVGVDVVFGIPGGAVLPAYDPLLDSKQIRHILVRHEQGAGHAATGYAQATGRVGVCMATSGPGATNLVTPLADAYMDSVPVVAITGQVATSLIGTDGFQEADISGITLPITKHNFLVTKPEDIARTIGEAFHLAAHRPARPGAGRHRQGRAAGDHRVQLAGPVRPARLPPGDPAALPAGPRGGQDDHRGQAAGALRRRRRDQGRRVRPSCGASPSSPAPRWSPR